MAHTVIGRLVDWLLAGRLRGEMAWRLAAPVVMQCI